MVVRNLRCVSVPETHTRASRKCACVTGVELQEHRAGGGVFPLFLFNIIY